MIVISARYCPATEKDGISYKACYFLTLARLVDRKKFPNDIGYRVFTTREGKINYVRLSESQFKEYEILQKIKEGTDFDFLYNSYGAVCGVRDNNN